MISEKNKTEIDQVTAMYPETKQAFDAMQDEYIFMLSKMSHEIRNPLTLIYSSLQLIQSQHPEVKEFKYWQEILIDVEYLRKLLLDMSTYNKGEKLTVSTINIEEMLSLIVVSNEAKYFQNNASILFHAEPKIPIVIGDATKLKQVFINLLKNACEAIDKKGIVCVDLSAADEYVEINIADNGMGIPPERYKDIFSPFVSFKETGSGLGLAISKRIIDAHEGTLTFSSKEGKGSTFTVRLPIL